MNKHLFATYRTPTTDQGNSATLVPLCEAVSLLVLFTRAWAGGLLTGIQRQPHHWKVPSRLGLGLMKAASLELSLVLTIHLPQNPAPQNRDQLGGRKE